MPTTCHGIRHYDRPPLISPKEQKPFIVHITEILQQTLGERIRIIEVSHQTAAYSNLTIRPFFHCNELQVFYFFYDSIRKTKNKSLSLFPFFK